MGFDSDKLESQLATELAQEIDGFPVGAVLNIPSSSDFCSSLELFLPWFLRSTSEGWRRESLDGFFFAQATKTGANSVELLGTCILITDQTVTPFFARLLLSDDRRSLGHVEVALGEPGAGNLGISGPPCNSKAASKLLESIVMRQNDVEWVYRASRGPHTR